MEDNNTEQNDMSMKELMQKIKEQNDALIEQKNKGGIFRIPFKARVSKARVNKNFATFQIIQDNREVSFIKAPIVDGTAMIEGVPRIATADHALSHKGKPFYIIPSWSLKPFSPVENYDRTQQEKMNITGRISVLARLERDIIKPKKNMGGIGGWIILGIIVIGLVWYFVGGGKFF